MLPVEYEPLIPADEQPQIVTLDHSAVLYVRCTNYCFCYKDLYPLVIQISLKHKGNVLGTHLNSEKEV